MNWIWNTPAQCLRDLCQDVNLSKFRAFYAHCAALLVAMLGSPSQPRRSHISFLRHICSPLFSTASPLLSLPKIHLVRDVTGEQFADAINKNLLPRMQLAGEAVGWREGGVEGEDGTRQDS